MVMIDGERPERSAVLLAPGVEDEDGRLEPREIVDLDLGGRAVVLASISILIANFFLTKLLL